MRNPHDGGDTRESWENDEKKEWQRTRRKKKEYVIDTIKKCRKVGEIMKKEEEKKEERVRDKKREMNDGGKTSEEEGKKKKKKMSSRFWRPEIYLARVVLPFAACNRCRKTQSVYLRGIIKSAREEWPRNPPGNGKMAITSASRASWTKVGPRFTRFSTSPTFATRFLPFAFNSSSGCM